MVANNLSENCLEISDPFQLKINEPNDIKHKKLVWWSQIDLQWYLLSIWPWRAEAEEAEAYTAY